MVHHAPFRRHADATPPARSSLYRAGRSPAPPCHRPQTSQSAAGLSRIQRNHPHAGPSVPGETTGKRPPIRRTGPGRRRKFCPLEIRTTAASLRIPRICFHPACLARIAKHDCCRGPFPPQVPSAAGCRHRQLRRPGLARSYRPGSRSRPGVIPPDPQTPAPKFPHTAPCTPLPPGPDTSRRNSRLGDAAMSPRATARQGAGERPSRPAVTFPQGRRRMILGSTSVKRAHRHFLSSLTAGSRGARSGTCLYTTTSWCFRARRPQSIETPSPRGVRRMRLQTPPRRGVERPLMDTARSWSIFSASQRLLDPSLRGLLRSLGSVTCSAVIVLQGWKRERLNKPNRLLKKSYGHLTNHGRSSVSPASVGPLKPNRSF